MKKLLVTSVVLTSLLTASPAFAVENTPFTSCLTPNGSAVASYPDGEHGIVGQNSRTGRDTVYSVGNGNFLQCFCGTDGAGIQTNWMKVNELSEDQVKVYQSQGWIYVPSGDAWGLDDTAYLAQNINFSCNGGSSTTTGGSDGRSDGKSDGRSDGKSSFVESATGNKGGLASTGNIVFVLSILLSGVVLTLSGFLLRKKSN